MMKSVAALVLLALVAGASATVFMKEEFDATWEDRWTHSSWKEEEGKSSKFKLTAGRWYGDEEADKGIQTGLDHSFYALYAPLTKKVDNKNKDLVLQYSVKHEQGLDCGGGYIKLIPSSVSADDMKDFGGETPYAIMFGPDICGMATRKVHFIITYNDVNYLIEKEIAAKTDSITHVYTMVLKPDNTYQVLIDLEEVASGSLEEDWSMLLPRQIKDPEATKPEDWDEREMILDENDVKPDGWDDIPATLPDPDAEKPEDWDDEEDGEWEPPVIANPDFKGVWKQKEIENPDYKGIWEAPLIDNPDFVEDPNLYHLGELGYAGFEIWQVKSGTIFDNIIITDSLDEAKEFAEATWGKSKEKENEMMVEIREAEQAKLEEERAAAAAAAEEEDDEYDEEEYDEEEVKDEL